MSGCAAAPALLRARAAACPRECARCVPALTPPPLRSLACPRRPDKEGLACAVCLDQTLRVFIVTKLNKL